jgi:hypothetical protein
MDIKAYNHNAGLVLMTDLLCDGYTTATLPLPPGTLEALENGSMFTEVGLLSLRRAHHARFGHSKGRPYFILPGGNQGPCRAL